MHSVYYISDHPNIMSKIMNTTNVASSLGGRYSLSLDMLFLVPEIQMLELLIACLVFIAIHSIRQKKYQGLPNWPLVGMLPSLIIGVRHDVYEWISEVICRMNGTFVFKGPWFTNLNCVITADPRNLEYLLKTKFSNFPKGEYFRNGVNDLLGNGIFSADDEIWQRQRKTASLEFHSAKFRQLTTESLLQLVHDRLVPVLEDSIMEAVPVDLQDVLLRLTFDNVCMIAFGVDPGCLSLGLPDIPFAQAFEAATETTTARFVTPTLVWKIMRFLNLGTERALRQSIIGIDEFAQEVIRTRKKELSLETEEIKQRSDLLTVFMRQKDERGLPLSDKFLRDVCVNFILAGRDTSSVALCWFFWLLNKHPEVEDKILFEICGIVNKRQDLSSEDYEEDLILKPEEVKKMEYLHAALSESLRLYPSVPVDHKEVLEDDIFPDGTILKKGTKVIYAIYTMGRMEAIWGKDCREYKPERWIRDGRFMSESAYKFTAFNGGPRLCLGKDFAYYQMKFVAASILYRYHVTVVKDHRVAPKMALTMYLKYGLKVQLSRRQKWEIQKYMR